MTVMTTPNWISLERKNQVVPIFILGAIGLSNIAVFWFDLYKIYIITNIACLLLLFILNLRKKIPLKFDKSLLLPFILYIYIYISTYWAIHPPEASEIFLYSALSSAPALLAGIYLTKNYSFIQCLRVIILFALPFFGQIIFNIYKGDDPVLVGDNSFRTILGVILCFVTPLSWAMYFHKREINSLFVSILLTVLSISIGSRSSVVLAIPASLIVYFVWNRTNAIRLLILSFLPVVFIFTFANPESLNRFSSQYTNFDVGSSVIQEFSVDKTLRVDFERRLHTFVASEMFEENAIFGGGYSSIGQYNSDNFGIFLVSHGIIPGFSAECGIFGLLLFFMFAFNAIDIRKLIDRNSIPRSEFLLYQSITISYCSLVSVGFFHQLIESPFFMLCMGLNMGFHWRLRSEAHRAAAAF